MSMRDLVGDTFEHGDDAVMIVGVVRYTPQYDGVMYGWANVAGDDGGEYVVTDEGDVYVADGIGERSVAKLAKLFA